MGLKDLLRRNGGVAPKGAFAALRFGRLDLLLILMAIAVYLFAPGYLPLATNVLIMCALALSLDLVVGFGGIDTLGQAAFFGAGAYSAGLYALHVSQEPLSGLAVGAAAAVLVAILSAPVILRTKGLSLVMLTLAVAAVLREVANSARSFTMGDDGLSGYAMRPILGLFAFDIGGRTAYAYAAIVAGILMMAARLIVNSVFGLTIRGIRDNPARMSFLGVSNLRHLSALYVMSAAIAGCAGALSAQIVGIVGLDSFSFLLSGNIMVALVIGGVGTLHGAIIGSILFFVLSDRAAAIDPVNWLFFLGLGLMLLVYLAPEGVVGGARKLAADSRRARRRGDGDRKRGAPRCLAGGGAREILWRAQGHEWRVAAPGTGRTPRGDRPQRSRQDDAHPPDLRDGAAFERKGAARWRRHHPALARAAREIGPRAHLPDQLAFSAAHGRGEFSRSRLWLMPA